MTVSHRIDTGNTHRVLARIRDGKKPAYVRKRSPPSAGNGAVFDGAQVGVELTLFDRIRSTFPTLPFRSEAVLRVRVIDAFESCTSLGRIQFVTCWVIEANWQQHQIRLIEKTWKRGQMV